MTDYSEMKEQFLKNLNLPDGVTFKHFEGMNRYHFKYYGTGFLTLDLMNNYYHLHTREAYLRAVGVFDYSLNKDSGPNPAAIKRIPYENTDVFYKLVRFITNEETDDINIAKRPLRVLNDKYVCPRCNNTFIKAPRCPECGQLIKD